MTRNTFISLQKGFLTLMSAALLFSCSNVETFEASDLKESQEAIAVKFKTTDANMKVGTGYNACGTPMIRDLVVGQNKSVGKVAVFNDEEKFYVTVSITESNWFIHKIHGKFGQAESDFLADPRGKQKKGIINPAPGQFPIKESITPDYTDANQEYTFELEIDDHLIDIGEFDIAVHAELIHVTKFNEEMTEAIEYTKESAWGQGIRFNPEGVGNWSMYMSYAIQPCAVACTDVWRRYESFTDEDATGNENERTVESGEFIIKDVGLVEFQRIRTNLAGSNRKYTITVNYSILPDLIGKGYSFQEFTAFTTGRLENHPDFIATDTNGGTDAEPHTSGQIVLEYTLVDGGGNQGQNSNYWQGFEAKLNGLCNP